MFLSIAILISIAISQRIDLILKNYENKVRTNAKELEELNQSLEEKVKEEIEKNIDKLKKLKLDISSELQDLNDILSQRNSSIKDIQKKKSKNGKPYTLIDAIGPVGKSHKIFVWYGNVDIKKMSICISTLERSSYGFSTNKIVTLA